MKPYLVRNFRQASLIRACPAPASGLPRVGQNFGPPGEDMVGSFLEPVLKILVKPCDYPSEVLLPVYEADFPTISDLGNDVECEE